MKDCIVGYTGFVGSNLYSSHKFEGIYNSKNIEEAFGTNPDMLFYSGVPAQKFIANKFPEKDFEVIENAIQNIKKINPKKIVLISTIDVYKNPNNLNEDAKMEEENLQAYGKNRLYLENWVKNNFEDYLIVRLPGLYGQNIKKNFIYDLISIIPSMIKEEKFEEITSNDNFLYQYYEKLDNGFFKCTENISEKERNELKNYFLNIGFSALNFTDSRAEYQFYNLKYLYGHICKAMENGIKILNLAVEPIKIDELYKFIKNEDFCNEILENVPKYDFKTKYDKIFGGENGYIFKKEFILKDIKEFVEKK